MRINIARYDKYYQARDLKYKLAEEYTDKVFQVRSKKDGFYVVERRFDPSNPAETIGPSKRRKRRRGIAF